MSSSEGTIVKKDGNWTINGAGQHQLNHLSNPDSRPRENIKLLSHHHPPNIPGKSLITLLVTLPPNAATPPHTHNGAAVTALMLRGASLNQMNEDEPHVYREGESWYEAPGCHHVRSENSCEGEGEEASLYAVFVVDDGVVEKEGLEGLMVFDAGPEGE
ncbi:MAG: hypothetical protein Q9222_002513 [Ikaeria aurantiellina]